MVALFHLLTAKVYDQPRRLLVFTGMALLVLVLAPSSRGLIAGVGEVIVGTPSLGQRTAFVGDVPSQVSALPRRAMSRSQKNKKIRAKHAHESKPTEKTTKEASEHNDSETTSKNAHRQSTPKRVSAHKSSNTIQVNELVGLTVLPPFYFIAVMNFGKMLLTSIVFGFGTAMAPKQEHAGCMDSVARVAKMLAGYASRAGFAALAMNTWYVDILKFNRIAHESWSGALAETMFIWITSANAVTAIAIWYMIVLQRPTSLFAGLQPKYMHIQGIPVLPGSVRWLPWDKHFYGLLVVPYALPMVLFTGVLFQSIGFILQCIFFWFACKPFMCSVSWACLVMLTLTLWSHAKDETHAHLYLDEGWTVFMLFGIGIINSVTLWGCSGIYAFALGAQSGAIMEFFSRYISKVFSFSEHTAEEDMWLPFRKFQDFSDFEQHGEPLNQAETSRELQNSAEACANDAVAAARNPTDEDRAMAKLSLICPGVDKASDILIYGQLCIITAVRVWHDGLPFMKALALTLGERHIKVYLGHLLALGQMSVADALDVLWGVI